MTLSISRRKNRLISINFFLSSHRVFSLSVSLSQIHKHPQTHTHIYTPKHTPMYKHTHIHTHAHPHVQAHTHPHARTRMHSSTHTSTRTHTHVRILTPTEHFVTSITDSLDFLYLIFASKPFRLILISNLFHQIIISSSSKKIFLTFTGTNFRAATC